MSDEPKKPACSGRDFVIPGPTVEGVRYGIRHSGDHGVSLGRLTMAKEGVPIPDAAEILQENAAGTYDVVGKVSDMKSNGPSKVTSDEYRSGWDRIFSTGRASGGLN